MAVHRGKHGRTTRRRLGLSPARTLWSTLLTTALVALALWVGPAADAAGVVDEVHYSFTGGTSVAIDWRGTSDDVRWGATTAYGSTARGSAPGWTPWSSAGPFWQLELTGLAPGATYHYSIGGGPDMAFHTPPTGALRFDAIGDVGDTASFGHLGGTLSAIANDNPSFVLMVGDLTYGNAPGASISVVDQHFNDIMNSWGTSAAYMPAWGNHEYDVSGSDNLLNYKGRLLMPHAQASPGSPDISCCGNDWGWFDAGPVRFVAYPEPWTGALADWQAKAGAILAQAQADPSIKYIVTYGHRPAYSTGYHPGEAGLADILDGFGDSFSKYVLNLNGHSHDYERFQPIHGVSHVTVGAPSSLELPWTSADPRTAFRAMHLSHLRVDVSDTGMRLQAVCDDASSKDDTTCANGSVLDEYTIGVPPSVPTTTSYYVDKTMPGCSDLGAGTATQPFCTIVKGVGRMQPGYTLFVGNGTYAETVKPTVSGTAAAPITVTAWPGKSPVIGTGVANGAYISTRSHIVISGLTFTGTTGDGIYVTKSDHVTVSGNTVTEAGRPFQSQTAPGISIRSTNASTVSGNTADHNNGHGIYLAGTSTGNTVKDNAASFNAEGWQRNANGIDVVAPGNSVLRNVTHDNEDSGINVYTGGDNTLVANNVTYNNGDHGIDDLNVSGGRILGNTVFHNCTTGINVEGTSSSYLVENNIAVDNAVYPAYNGLSCSRRAGNIGIWDSAPATTTVDHNLVYLSKSGVMYAFTKTYTSLAALQTATGQESHGVQSDPQWKSQATSDFQLVEGSAAIDRGDSAPSDQPASDILGNPRVDDLAVANTYATGPRGYDDLGAFEYQPDQAPAPDPPVARLSVTPTSGTAPVQVTADASASTTTSGQALRYQFDFGDGTTTGSQAGATANHTYSTGGTYVVKVTVTDTGGLYDTSTRTVQVADPPRSPDARLSVSPATGRAPLPVTADASASSDPQDEALTYAFDFGDGTTTGPQTPATSAHTYQAAGTYVVTVTATNAGGLSSTASQSVTVSAPPSAPDAQLTVTPTGGQANLPVTADASGSTDPRGGALTFAFDFGDGTTTGNQAGATADHTYVSAGTYVVTVTVTDADGLASSTSADVVVSPAPSAPTAALSVSPDSGTAPVPVTADASGSSDPQGQALSYAFDFGDGTTVGPQADATAQHSYATGGTFMVTVTVTNTSGLSDSTTGTVTIAPSAASPTAGLSVSPDSGTAPVQVTADASGSTDPQGQTLSYAFDFGDGTTVGPQADTTAQHTYASAGSFTVTVTVTDTSGLTDSTSRTMTVAPAPLPPTARLSLTPTTGTAPVQVAADASGSTDPQGQTLSYTFDFGDGTTVGPQADATAQHTYATSGTFTVQATVTDTSGLSDSTTKTVTVSPAPLPPTAMLTLTPTTGTAPVQVTANASASTDPQGQALTYAFDFGDGTTAGPQAGATAQHTYTAAGTFTVKVTVTDTSGLSASTTATETVSPAPAYVGRVATASSGTASRTAVVTLAAPVKAGDLVVLSAQAGTGSTKKATANDSAGNTYTVALERSDSTGAELSVLYGRTTKALAAGSTITITFPTTTTYRITADELTGVTALDKTAVATGRTSAFSSGATKTTVAVREVVLGVLGVTAGNGSATWGSAWTDAGSFTVGTSLVGRASRVSTQTGTFTASGTTSGTWTAAVLTFRP